MCLVNFDGVLKSGTVNTFLIWIIKSRAEHVFESFENIFVLTNLCLWRVIRNVRYEDLNLCRCLCKIFLNKKVPNPPKSSNKLLELKRFAENELPLMLHIRGLQTFLPEGHISYCTTVRGPHTLHNVIVSGYATFYEINKCFVNVLFFHYWQCVFAAG